MVYFRYSEELNNCVLYLPDSFCILVFKYMNDAGMVSIVTPTYNCGRFIAETIRSVQAQSYQNWEMLIIDDCSTDDTREIVANLALADSRIKYHCLEKNSGAAVARNTALRMAQGRWIAFLDSDDVWEPRKLELQIDFMIRNGYSFSCTDRDVIDENSRHIGRYITGPRRITKFGMLCYCWVGCLTVMYDKNKIGLIQIADIKKNNDYAIWLKAIKKSDCYLLKEKLASYRIRTGSISNHSVFKLIKWHYKLFREAENYNPIMSLMLTLLNIFCGVAKKLLFIKRINDGKE